MATLKNIFDKCGVALYQNESLDLDHYYQEPYQDEGDEIKVIGEPFETDKSKKIRPSDRMIYLLRIVLFQIFHSLWTVLVGHTKLVIL